ncbi:hypothetical protein ACSSS7_008301 [Eimeria intestinalis]
MSSAACSGTDEELRASLHAQGLPVRLCWVSDWLRQRGPLEAACGEAAEAALAAAFLSSDLRETGDPQLPLDVASWHRRRLAGVYLLQLLHAVNINQPHKQRSNIGLSKHRCLKLALTDGHMVVVAIEYKRISKLNEESLGLGAKFLVYGHPEVCRGLLFLQEANIRVVWGGHPPSTTSEAKNAAPPQALLHPPGCPQAPAAPTPYPASSAMPQGPTHAGNSDYRREAARTQWGPLQQGPFTAPHRGSQAAPQGDRGAAYQREWAGAPIERQGALNERQEASGERRSPHGQASHGILMQGAPVSQRGPPHPTAISDVKSGTARGPRSEAPQGLPSYQQSYETEASDLLIDLEDIADAFGQDNSPLHSTTSQWRGPQMKSGGPHLRQMSPGAPAELSRAAESCPAAFVEVEEGSNPGAGARNLSASLGHEKRSWCMQSSQGEQTPHGDAACPFWLFGAVLDAREARSGEAEWELLVTDGMRVFLAFASGAMTERMGEAVNQPALYPSLPAVERLRSVQGHFFISLKGKHGEEEQAHVIGFRAMAPASELTEKLKFLYSAITGKHE